jgi:hypothetical protein
MYTQNYLNSKSKVNKLELIFKNNPCKNTAVPLSQSRVELEKIESNHSLKFTPEFLAAEKNQTISDIRECMVNIINN